MKPNRMKVFTDGRCACRTILVSAFAVVAFAVMPAFASAAEWSFQFTPAIESVGLVNLSDVSCLTASSCIAVGKTGSTEGKNLVGEYWNGTEWKLQSVNEKASATSLLGVSCTSSTACEAVGIVGKTDKGAAAAWNGTEWKSQTMPPPVAGSLNQFNSVSCSSSTNCMAVGYLLYIGGISGDAERWNGEEWKVVSVVKPTGSTEWELRGVSCTSATACIAIGNYYTSSGGRTLAESWNGTEWKIQTTPNPVGGTGERGFQRVSCTSSTACTAVGAYGEPAEPLHNVPFAERWNGTEWKIQSVPRPESQMSASLNAVSCTSSTACTAVGSSEKNMLAELWNGTEWKVQPTPQPGGSDVDRLCVVFRARPRPPAARLVAMSREGFRKRLRRSTTDRRHA